MDVSFGVFSPGPVLGTADEFDDALLDTFSDDGLFLEFSPMDICSNNTNVNDLDACLCDVGLSLNNSDETTELCTVPAQNIDKELPCSDIDHVIAKPTNTSMDCSDIRTKSDKHPKKSKPTAKANKKSNNCDVCGVKLRKNSSCKKCVTSSKLTYDSGVASGEDNSNFVSEKNKTESETLDSSENLKSLRRSGRQRHSIDREYELRTSSLINRVEVERRKSTPRQPKPKSKPPPLSKYRRKTANARERTRMNEINDGFEQLKNAIPELPKGKLTKIATLRFALDYISAMREMLGYKNDLTNEKIISDESTNTISYTYDTNRSTSCDIPKLTFSASVSSPAESEVSTTSSRPNLRSPSESSESCLSEVSEEVSCKLGGDEPLCNTIPERIPTRLPVGMQANSSLPSFTESFSIRPQNLGIM